MTLGDLGKRMRADTAFGDQADFILRAGLLHKINTTLLINFPSKQAKDYMRKAMPEVSPDILAQNDSILSLRMQPWSTKNG